MASPNHIWAGLSSATELAKKSDVPSVINALTSTSTASALSAAQGKILNDKIVAASPNPETLIYSATLSTPATSNQSYPYNFVTSGITAQTVSAYNILRLRVKITSWTIFTTYGSSFRINCGSDNSDASIVTVDNSKKSEAINNWFEIKFTRDTFRELSYVYNPINWGDYKNFPIVSFSSSGCRFSFEGGYGKFSIELYGSNF